MKVFQKIYADPERVAEQFARHLAEWMAESEKEHFHIALSGGSTPRLLFDLIARDYANKFPWDMVHFWWGDERCVPPDDADSNYGMTRRHLLDHIDIPEQNIHRVRGENDPETEAIRYGKEIQEYIPQENGWPVFDLIMLGLGTDGHTASIFPHEMELWENPNVCVVATHPDSGQKRVSLTGGVINEGKRIAFLATGGSKTEKYVEIVEQKGAYKSYPASYVKPEKGDLYWFIDQAAAGQ